MRYFITGGAGFIGINFADILLSRDDDVIVFDNFSRKGTLENIRWLTEKHPRVEIVQGDIRIDKRAIFDCVSRVDIVHHLAAQVAVTTSVTQPECDFQINALGTFNVLEAVRRSKNMPLVIYASTNKVYGGMKDVGIVEKDGRYVFKDLRYGVDESFPLDFHSPYGCSKGTGDQYTVDYARTYGLRTAVMRQSCIYGRHQLGIEDQGWLAWFAICALLDKKITIFGDGKQIRDVLFIDDLFKAWDLAPKYMEEGKSRIFNLGGGPQNILSLLELIDIIEEIIGRKIDYDYDNWRTGDQKVFICDIRKAKQTLGWEPKVDPKTGVGLMLEWIQENKDVFQYLHKI